MRFIYQPNVIFSNPITTTPAALPIIKIEPPTPAQYAKSCQKMPSTAISPVGATGYIPIQPATKGTLSTILEMTPITPVTI